MIPLSPASLGFKVTMYVLSMAAVSLACSAAPITFEFCVELSYPVSEGLLGEATQEHCRLQCCSAAVMQCKAAVLQPWHSAVMQCCS